MWFDEIEKEFEMMGESAKGTEITNSTRIVPKNMTEENVKERIITVDTTVIEKTETDNQLEEMNGTEKNAKTGNMELSENQRGKEAGN